MIKVTSFFTVEELKYYALYITLRTKFQVAVGGVVGCIIIHQLLSSLLILVVKGIDRVSMNS